MSAPANPPIPPGAPGRHVVLLGLMASGKSTVGRPLAARLGREFVDNDDLLRARTGHTAREIAEAEGPAMLHRREVEALVAALERPVPAVVAAAAGAALEPGAAPAVRSQFSVYLRVTPEILVARLAAAPGDDDHRPFVDGDARAVIEAQFASRDGGYRALATITVDAGVGAPGAIVDEIVEAIIAALGR